MSNQSRRAAKARPVANQLQAAIKNPVISDDDPTAFLDLIEAKVTELQGILQPARRGPKIKRVRRRLSSRSTFDLPKPRNKIERKEWIECRIRRYKREHDIKAMPASTKRPLVIQLLAELERMVPGHGLTVDYFMRRHQ